MYNYSILIKLGIVVNQRIRAIPPINMHLALILGGTFHLIGSSLFCVETGLKAC